jgi:dethiobiotin synthetase
VRFAPTGAPSAQALKKWLGGSQRMLADDPSLLHLSPLLSPASFVVDGYIGFGVPIGTDTFIQHFVKKDKCEAIMEDVDKLGSIQDGFIHYQLLHLCQATRLQYLNGHIDLANQNVRQQQHVRPKLPMPFLKRTRDAYKTWNQQDRAWAGM